MDKVPPGMSRIAVEANAARRIRTVPPWVASWEAKCGPPPPELQSVVPPPQAVRTDRNTTAATAQGRASRDGFVNWTTEAPAQAVQICAVAKKRQRRREQQGKKWDHLRTREPIIIPSYRVRSEVSQWKDFVQASRYGHQPGEKAERVDVETLGKLMPGFNDTSPLSVTDFASSRRSRRAAFHEHVWHVLLHHPLVPALLRFFVLILSIVSLALSANLWKLYAQLMPSLGVSVNIDTTLRSQWLVVLAVDCVATPYVFYMTYDEYGGPQLGLRSRMHKVSLSLLDLFFIIFKSVSATLAFDSLSIQGSSHGEMAKMKALSAFLLLGLIGWIMNFTVNVFRLVQRLGTDGEDRFRFLVHV